MSFGHYCFFYIAAASVALPLFTFGRLSFTILLAPFLRFAAPCPGVFVRLLCSSLLVQALLVPPFYIGFSLFGRFLRGSLPSTSFTLKSPRTFRYPASPAAPDLTPLAPISLSRHFYVFALFLAKVRKCKREFLHFNRRNYSFHGIFLSNIFGSLAKKLYFCIDCCREITCLVKSSLVFVLVNGSPVASETPINSYMSIVYVFIRNMNYLSFPFQPS